MTRFGACKLNQKNNKGLQGLFFYGVLCLRCVHAKSLHSVSSVGRLQVDGHRRLLQWFASGGVTFQGHWFQSSRAFGPLL